MKDLMAQLKHGNPAQRADALKQIVKQRGKAALPLVQKVADADSDPRVRKLANSIASNLQRPTKTASRTKAASTPPQQTTPTNNSAVNVDKLEQIEQEKAKRNAGKKNSSGGVSLTFIVFVIAVVLGGASIIFWRYSLLDQSGTLFVRGLGDPQPLPRDPDDPVYQDDLQGNYYRASLNSKTDFYVLEPNGAPPSDEGYGLMLAVHGSGGNGTQMILPNGHRTQRHGIILVAPTFTEIYTGSGEYDIDYMSRDISRILQEVDKRYNLDPDKVVMYGFSMGGIATYGFTVRNPGVFAGAGVFGSRAYNSLPPRNSPVRYVVMSGARDERTPQTIEFLQRMDQRGTPVWYSEIVPNVGHTMTGSMYDKLFEMYESLG